MCNVYSSVRTGVEGSPTLGMWAEITQYTLECIKVLLLSNIKHKDFRLALLLRGTSCSGYPAWILKQGGLESSDQRLISDFLGIIVIYFCNLLDDFLGNFPNCFNEITGIYTCIEIFFLLNLIKLLFCLIFYIPFGGYEVDAKFVRIYLF